MSSPFCFCLVVQVKTVTGPECHGQLTEHIIPPFLLHGPQSDAEDCFPLSAGQKVMCVPFLSLTSPHRAKFSSGHKESRPRVQCCARRTSYTILCFDGVWWPHRAVTQVLPGVPWLPMPICVVLEDQSHRAAHLARGRGWGTG